MRYRAFAIAAGLIAATPVQAEAPMGLVIHPGESIIFRLVDGQPADVRRAEDNVEAKDGEISARMSGGGMVMLAVRNSGGEALNYRAFIVRGDQDKGRRTSVCTLFPGVLSMETWQEPIGGIRVADFTPAGDSIGCF